MAPSSPYQIQQCLEKASAKYIESAKQDILAALREFTDVNSDTEHFMFPDGKRKTAVRLRGTIPVYYKGGCYNIPVSVYLWETHPYYAPICYVNPTSEMVIRESDHVDKSGRVYLPYLKEWRYPGYDLNGLLQVMAMVFAEKCPVFAKNSGAAAVAATTATPPSSQPTAYASNPPYPSANPAQTPYPSANTFPSATPYPTTGNSSPYMNTPYPASGGFPMHSQQQQQQQAPQRPAPPVPPALPARQGNVDHIRESVLSAVEGTVRIRLRDKLGTTYAEMASLGDTKKDLQSGQQKLRQMIDMLEKHQADLEKFIFTYQSKKKELEEIVAQSGGATESSIDESIDPPTPLHRQLLLNHAKDAGCDDAIYALGQGMKRGLIPLPDYLKHVRNISRRQFEYRATIRKCRSQAGLQS